MTSFRDIAKGPGGRRFPGIRGRAPHNKSIRCATALVVAAKRKSRSPSQQMAELDVRLGPNVGAAKERVRLRGMLRGGQ